MKTRFLIVLSVLCIFIQFWSVAAVEATKYAIRAGKILTMAPLKGSADSIRVVDNGVVLVSDGKIEAIGTASEVQIPDGYVLIDASDRWVMPGIVEAHTHIGTEGGFNDMVTPINPELRITDCVDPESHFVRKALEAGVTTINTMPGSGTNLAGFSVIVKTTDSSPEEIMVRELGMMKMTQAYNPERRGGDLGLTRMGMSWMLRQILKRAKEYTDAWKAYERGEHTEEPEFKPELEKMRKVFNGEIPTIVHTYEGWGVMQSIRMFNDENQLNVVLTHTAGGGYKIGEEAAKRPGVSVNIGPRLLDFSWSADRDNRFHGMGAEYHKAGVRNFSINTDASWYGQEDLAYQASMSARLGLNGIAALKAITINSGARALAIDDRVGSLEVGKDADIVIKKGSLLDVTTPVDLVLIDGEVAYQRKGFGIVDGEKK